MKVLLHVCCAPCAPVASERLRDAGHEVALFFCNPNIHPAAERNRRLEEARTLARRLGVRFLSDDGDFDGWHRGVAPLAPRGERSARCRVCFAWRLDATARAARRGGFDAFTTTLTTGRQKKSRDIFRIGRMLGGKHGLVFIAEDFKKRDGAKKSEVYCREHGLYRQDYCGCEWSLAEMEKRKAGKQSGGGANA
jgi:predicted adenine nucleotide alpha hydrolase (AANH) superfamily ATPase